MTAERLNVEQRQEIFRTLVVAQDTNSVAHSRKLVSDQFNISEDQVRSIENEGIDNEWPPLG